MMAFSSIAETVAEIYQVRSMLVNSCVIVFFVCFIALNFISVTALESRNGQGLIFYFKVLSLVTIVGAWIKFIALAYFNNFYFLICG